MHVHEKVKVETKNLWIPPKYTTEGYKILGQIFTNRYKYISLITICDATNVVKIRERINILSKNGILAKDLCEYYTRDHLIISGTLII